MAIIQPYHANLYAHVKVLKYQALAHDIKATTRRILVLFASATLVFMVACVFAFICTPTPPTHQRVGNIRVCTSPHVNPTIPNVFYFCTVVLAMWRVLCSYMSAAKHFGFVRSCLAAISCYLFILLGSIFFLLIVRA